MKEKYILKLFIGFLKKNNVYNEYIKSLIESKSSANIEPLSFIIKTIKIRPRSLIVDAFDWSSCKYCPHKWYDLHNEWWALYCKHFPRFN